MRRGQHYGEETYTERMVDEDRSRTNSVVETENPCTARDHFQLPHAAIPKRRNSVCRSNEQQRGNEMRIFVVLLIVLAALYYWDVNYNNGTPSDGLIRMERSM